MVVRLWLCLIIGLFAISGNASIIATDTRLTPLMEACRRSNFAEVKHLVEANADVNARSGHYRRTALMYALQDSTEPLPMVKLLLEHGADINAEDNEGNTALMFGLQGHNSRALQMIEKDKCPAIVLLLQSGADVKPQNRNGDTALSIACCRKFDKELISMLLERGASVKSRNYNGLTPLLSALDGQNDAEIIKLLLEKGANPNDRDYRNRPALLFANDNTSIKLLLQNGADIKDADTESPVLQSWSEWIDMELLLFALKNQCNINTEVLLAAAKNPTATNIVPLLLEKWNGEKPLPFNMMLSAAANAVNYPAVQLFYNYGGRPSPSTLTDAICAHGSWNAETQQKITEFLLERGASISMKNSKGDYVFIVACKNFMPLTFLSLLLHHGAIIDQVNNEERTAFQEICRANRCLRPGKEKDITPWLNFLKENQASLKPIDKNNASALLLALGNQQTVSAIKWLLDNGAEVNAASKSGVTPLMLAARHYDAEIVKLLLDKGADINAADSSGWTPLFYAAEFWPESSYDVITPKLYCRKPADANATIRLLLERGANADISDKYGNNPLIEAAAWADAPTLKLLLDQGRRKSKDYATRKMNTGENALRRAMINNHNDAAVMVLLEPGAEIMNAPKSGSYQCHNTNEIDEGKIGIGNRYVGDEMTAFETAIASNRQELVKFMLKNGADPNSRHQRNGDLVTTPLACSNKSEMAKLLIDAGAKKYENKREIKVDKNDVDINDFYQACQTANVTDLKLIYTRLQFKDDAIKLEFLVNALRKTIENNTLDVVKWILSLGEKYYAAGTIPKFVPQDLLLAAKNGDHPEVLEFLLRQGVPLMHRPSGIHENIYALHIAASAKIVDILVANGMEVNAAPDSSRQTPLMAALTRNWPHELQWRQYEVVDALLRHGADLARLKGDWWQYTTGRTRGTSPDLRLLKIMLKYADVNAVDSSGKTLLQLAAERENCRLVDFLLEHGAKTLSPEQLKKCKNRYILRRMRESAAGEKKMDSTGIKP